MVHATYRESVHFTLWIGATCLRSNRSSHLAALASNQALTRLLVRCLLQHRKDVTLTTHVGFSRRYNHHNHLSFLKIFLWHSTEDKQSSDVASRSLHQEFLLFMNNCLSEIETSRPWNTSSSSWNKNCFSTGVQGILNQINCEIIGLWIKTIECWMLM